MAGDGCFAAGSTARTALRPPLALERQMTRSPSSHKTSSLLSASAQNREVGFNWRPPRSSRRPVLGEKELRPPRPARPSLNRKFATHEAMWRCLFLAHRVISLRRGTSSLWGIADIEEDGPRPL